MSGSDIVPYGNRGGFLPSRRERQFSRALGEVQDSAGYEIAQVRGIEAVELAKVEAIGAVGDVAQRETARLSMNEAGYVSTVPHAEGRLRHVTDSTVLEMAGRIHRLGRRLG